MADFRDTTIYVEGKKVPLREALKIMTNYWIEYGEYCDQSVIDLRDALNGAVIDADKSDDVRKGVKEFAEKMEKKLKVNDHKDGWHVCKISYLLRCLVAEVKELNLAITDGVSCNKVESEAADVANFAMMVADRYKMLRSQSENCGRKVNLNKTKET
jgi:hypothetical protein